MNVQERDEQLATWMRAAIKGDADAYRHFLGSVAPYLRSMAQRRCRVAGVSEGDAEDIVQEVLLAIHLKRSTWDPARPIGPWIATITRNKFIDALRRRGGRIVVPIDDIAETLGAEEKDDGLSAHEMDLLLSKLNTQHRDIVKSISINGNSIRETATRLELTEGAVRVALHRALKRLAALYRSQAS